MRVGIQASCYEPHNAGNENDTVGKTFEGSPSSTLDWKKHVEELLDEVQTIALTMTLDARYFSSNDRLEAEFCRTERQFFPSWFDTRRMRRIFRKLGQDVLRRTLHNAPMSSSAKATSKEYLLDRYQDHHIRNVVLSDLCEEYPCLVPGLADVHTWRDLYKCVGHLPGSERIKKHVQVYQHEAAKLHQGMTSGTVLSPTDEETIQEGLQSLDPGFTDNKHIRDIFREVDDMVFVRASMGADGSDDLVTAYSEGYIITLRPLFFSNNETGRLSDAPISPGDTDVEDLVESSRLCTLLHELLHGCSVADLRDVQISQDAVHAAEMFSAYHNDRHADLAEKPPAPDGHEPKEAYGQRNCIALGI